MFERYRGPTALLLLRQAVPEQRLFAMAALYACGLITVPGAGRHAQMSATAGGWVRKLARYALAIGARPRRHAAARLGRRMAGHDLHRCCTGLSPARRRSGFRCLLRPHDLGIIILGRFGTQPTWTEAQNSDKGTQGPLWHFSAVSSSRLQDNRSQGSKSSIAGPWPNLRPMAVQQRRLQPPTFNEACVMLVVMHIDRSCKIHPDQRVGGKGIAGHRHHLHEIARRRPRN